MHEATQKVPSYCGFGSEQDELHDCSKLGDASLIVPMQPCTPHTLSPLDVIKYSETTVQASTQVVCCTNEYLHNPFDLPVLLFSQPDEL